MMAADEAPSVPILQGKDKSSGDHSHAKAAALSTGEQATVDNSQSGAKQNISSDKSSLKDSLAKDTDKRLAEPLELAAE